MRLFRLLPLLAASLAITACDKAEEASAPKAETAAAPEAEAGLSASGGVLVLPAVKGRPGAAYFTLNNRSGMDVVLAAAAVEGAGKTEMHQTEGGKMMPVERLEVGPGATVAFARGGLHLMVFDLPDSVKPGDSVDLTLTFADGDKLSTSLKAEAAGSATAGMDHGAAH